MLLSLLLLLLNTILKGLSIKMKWNTHKIICIPWSLYTNSFLIKQAFIECLLCAKPCSRHWSCDNEQVIVPTFMVFTAEGRGETGKSRGSYDTVCQGFSQGRYLVLWKLLGKELLQDALPMNASWRLACSSWDLKENNKELGWKGRENEKRRKRRVLQSKWRVYSRVQKWESKRHAIQWAVAWSLRWEKRTWGRNMRRWKQRAQKASECCWRA